MARRERANNLSPGLGLAARWLFGLAMGFTIVWSFEVKELKNFQQPELARILFWHLPCPIIASVLLGVGAYYSWRQLRSGDLRWDIKAVAAVELGAIFSVLTMASGMVFSRVQWGAWWQSDPRQTSFALVLMICFAYFILRGAFHDRARKAAYASGYALAAILPVLFLIYVFPYLPQIANQSLHPTGTILKGELDGSYEQVIWATMSMTAILAIWLFRLRVRAGEIELKTYESIGLETHGGDPATVTVVRPVRLPADGRSEASESAGEPDAGRA